MEPTLGILSAVSIANMSVLGILMVNFGKMYSQTKGAASAWNDSGRSDAVLKQRDRRDGVFSVEELFSHDIFPYMLGVNIAELAGLLIFLKISMD